MFLQLRRCYSVNQSVCIPVQLSYVANCPCTPEPESANLARRPKIISPHSLPLRHGAEPLLSAPARRSRESDARARVGLRPFLLLTQRRPPVHQAGPSSEPLAMTGPESPFLSWGACRFAGLEPGLFACRGCGREPGAKSGVAVAVGVVVDEREHLAAPGARGNACIMGSRSSGPWWSLGAVLSIWLGRWWDMVDGGGAMFA